MTEIFISQTPLWFLCPQVVDTGAIAFIFTEQTTNTIPFETSLRTLKSLERLGFNSVTKSRQKPPPQSEWIYPSLWFSVSTTQNLYPAYMVIDWSTNPDLTLRNELKYGSIGQAVLAWPQLKVGLQIGPPRSLSTILILDHQCASDHQFGGFSHHFVDPFIWCPRVQDILGGCCVTTRPPIMSSLATHWDHF